MKWLAAALLAIVPPLPGWGQTDGSWSFAVSGDSRNCGDVVMPSIAAKVRADKAAFYWHLGDFRALYDFDQDMLAARHGKLTVQDYQNQAWQDFIDQQLAPFGDVPVYLALGNHEMVGKTRPDLLVQFADWFDAPVIRAQRLADNPTDHTMHTYFHVRVHNVDFITVDNASPEEFDAAQMRWFEALLKRDEADPAIRTVVVGMHDALPDSVTAGHSMNESAAGTQSGRRMYADLVGFRGRSGKEVQVLASHSHYLISDAYKTACHKPDEVLPGWIVGTAGAVRYRLPADHANSAVAQTDVYGYLLGRVDAQGHITFAFHDVPETDILPEVNTRYGKDLVHQCFAGNKSDYAPEGPTCPAR